jgi:hypothetical protein
MTPAEFTGTHEGMNITRAELCRRIGIAPNSGTAYAKGRKAVPLTVALACAAVKAGIGPTASPDQAAGTGSAST